MTGTTAPRTTGDGSSAVAPLSASRWQRLLWRVTGYLEDNADSCKVVNTTAATVAVGAVGDPYAIRGYEYEVASVDTFDLSTIGTQPTGTNVRIDRIVLRLTRGSTNQITTAVLAGTPASAGSAVAPGVTRSSSVWEVSLATVRRLGTSPLVIQPGDLTDTRMPAPENSIPAPAITVQRYASASARDTGNPSPVDGTWAYLTDIGQLQIRQGGAWVAVPIPSPTRPLLVYSAADGSWEAARPVPTTVPIMFVVHPSASASTALPSWKASLDFQFTPTN